MESILVEWAADQQIQIKEMGEKIAELQSYMHAIIIGYVACVVVLVCYQVFNYKSSKKD